MQFAQSYRRDTGRSAVEVLEKRKEGIIQLKKSERGKAMDMNKVTLQDCINMADLKGRYAVIDDGKLVGFTSEKK